MVISNTELLFIVLRAPRSPAPLQFGAELDAVSARRRILREAGQEVARRRCVDERVRQVSAPQSDGVRAVVHMPVQSGVDIVIGGLTQLVVCLPEPSAVVKVLLIERPVSYRCRYQIAQS